jgi:hypothetical protein
MLCIGGGRSRTEKLALASLALRRGSSFRRCTQIGMPDGQRSSGRWRIGEMDSALGIGSGRPGAVGDDNECGHCIMDVAAERDTPGFSNLTLRD